VRYRGNSGIYPIYECNWLRREGLATKNCLNFRCDLLDPVVSEEVLKVLQPAELELALAAMRELERRDEAIMHQWQMRLQRAEYEAALAEREDGKADLAIAADIWVYVLLGNGDGTFAPAMGSPIRVASPPYNDLATPLNTAIVAGDFNHSRHLGLAVAEQPNGAAYILLGKGDGTFSPSSAAFANSGGWIDTMAAADLNRDGNLDIAFQGPVALGYGDGAFSAAGNLYASGIPNGMALGDFNQDGNLDAIVASGYTAGPGSSGSGLAVSLGKGDGTFTRSPNSPIALGASIYRPSLRPTSMATESWMSR